jgi:hypothetical protein
MKKLLLNIILSITIVFSISSCGLFKKCQKTEPTYGTQMVNSYVMQATSWQVDSICTADALPKFDTWYKTTFKDFETGETIYKYIYIKESGEREIIYIIEGKKEPYNVTRRITQ